MLMPNNILKQKLQNVYFIWGCGKTTAANELQRRYGYPVYHTDDNRARHVQNADPLLQPGLCRKVPDIWALSPQEAAQWEGEIVREFTPMVIADLLLLAAKHDAVICEGDIDIDCVMPVVTHAVTISNYGTPEDFFDRPQSRHMLEEIRSRNISDEEKEALLRNAYEIVGGNPTGKKATQTTPRETLQYGVKQIIRNDLSTAEATADMIAAYFGLPHAG